MTSKDLIDACDILVKLEQEFATEEARLSEISNDHAMRIDELDQQITTFRRNEDVDFRVFSPRNISTGTSDKIKAFEGEKKQLEREKKEADKQLRYYSGKTEMIGRVLSLLRGDLKEDSDEDSITLKKSRNPFAFLDETDRVEMDDETTDNVAALFKEPVKENDAPEPDNSDEIDDVQKNNFSGNGVPVDDVERVCHKVEFCESIVRNDGVRAKLEMKNIVAELKDLIRAYSK